MLQYSDFCILLRMNALSRSMEEGPTSPRSPSLLHASLPSAHPAAQRLTGRGCAER